MKKVLSIIFMFSLFLVCIISVRAEKYNCTYETTLPESCNDQKKVEVSFEVDEEKKDIYFKSKIFDYEVYYLDDMIDKKFTKSYVVESYEGKCPRNVYGCTSSYKKNDFGASGGFGFLGPSTNAVGIIFNAESKIKMPDSVKYKQGLDTITFKKSKCYSGSYVSSKSDRPAVESPFECSFYDNYIGENGYLKKNYCKLGDGGCTTDKIVEYKRKKEELVATCRQYLQNGDYWDQCVKKCITLPDDIASIEGKKATNPCGFSGKLYYWIQNIMKWIKYILPVIVIIFGILDFIKAMANESDEEMKKSQKRFVIRLVSAALVFLVPLIIQFVLEKMGFNANACGLW